MPKENLITSKSTTVKGDTFDRKSDVRSEASSKASAEVKNDKPLKDTEKGRSSLNESVKSVDSFRPAKTGKKKHKERVNKAKMTPTKPVGESLFSREQPRVSIIYLILSLLRKTRKLLRKLRKFH